MAWSYTITHDTVMGDVRVVTGTTVQASGDTGGDIKTTVSDLYYFECTGLLTYSLSGSTVTVETLDPGKDQAGHWVAMGYT